MALLSRLDRLAPVLTAKERFLIVLAAFKEGRQADDEVRRMPPSQQEEFREYCRVTVTLNDRLGVFINVIDYRIQRLGADLERAELLEGAAGLMEEAEGIPATRPVKNWRKSKELITSPAFVRSLALELREMVGEEADLMAEELAAIEAVWHESEEELGVDLIHPDVKGAMAQASQALTDLRLELGKRRRVVPSAEVLDRVRTFVRQSAGIQEMEDLQ